MSNNNTRDNKVFDSNSIRKTHISVPKKQVLWVAVLFLFIAGANATTIGDDIRDAIWVNATWFKGDGGNLTGINASLASKGTLAETRFPTSYNATQVYNVKAFGAMGDGVANDTTAIQDAIDTVPHGSKIFFPPGTYILGGGIKSTNSKTIVLEGAGKNESIIKSTFADGDILVIGNVGANTHYPVVRGLSFFSSVYRTSGYAINFTNVFWGWIDDVNILDNSPYSAQTQSNGILMNGFDNSFITHTLIQTRQNGTTDNMVGIGIDAYATGVAGGTGLFISNSRLLGTGTCIRVGGGVGGLSIRDTDMSTCREVGMQIDETKYALTNTQIFLGSGATIDTAGTGINISSTSAQVYMSGAWVASSQAKSGNYVNATGIGINVSVGELFAVGSIIRDNAADGVKIASGTGVYLEGNYIQNNVRYGVNYTGTKNSLVVVGNNYYDSNTAGDVNGQTSYPLGGILELRSGSQIMFRPLDNSYDMRVYAKYDNVSHKIQVIDGGANERFSLEQPGNFNISTSGKGITMRSPDGTFYCLTIANGGTTAVGAGVCS